MSMEGVPKFNKEPEKGSEMAKKLRKLVLPIAMLFGVGAGIENINKNNASEKSGSNKPDATFTVENDPEKFKVHKSGEDTYKSEGNISVEQPKADESELEPIIITAPRYHPETDAKEDFKVHKSVPDTLKSDEYEH